MRVSVSVSSLFSKAALSVLMWLAGIPLSAASRINGVPGRTSSVSVLISGRVNRLGRQLVDFYLITEDRQKQAFLSA